MPLDTFTRDELLDFIRAQIRSFHGSADLSEFSDYDIEARILASLAFGNQAQAEYVARQIFPRTADPDFIDEHLRARGMRRRAATKASGLVIVTSKTAAAPASIPAGTRLVDGAGNVYETKTAVTTALAYWSRLTGYGSREHRIVLEDASGINVNDVFEARLDFGGGWAVFAVQGLPTSIPAIDTYRRHRFDLLGPREPISTVWGAVVEIEAVEAGSHGNLPEWDSLSFESSPPANADDSVVVLRMSGGADEETTEQARERLVAYDSARSGQGTPGDYYRFATEFDRRRIARVFVFPNVFGLGTSTIVAEGIPGARELPSTVLAELETHLNELKPMSDVLDVRTTSYASDVDVDLVILPRVGFEPDWGPTPENPSAPGSFNVALTGSTTTTVVLTSDPSGVIEIGDRVLVQSVVGSRRKLNQVTVTGVNASAANSLDIDTTLESAPIPSTPVRPGSPLSSELIEAIETLFDDLGPGTNWLVNGRISERLPDVSIQGDDTLRVSDIIAAVMSVSGVEDVEVRAPLSDQIQPLLSTFRLGQLLIDYELV